MNLTLTQLGTALLIGIIAYWIISILSKTTHNPTVVHQSNRHIINTQLNTFQRLYPNTPLTGPLYLHQDTLTPLFKTPIPKSCNQDKLWIINNGQISMENHTNHE